MDHACWERPEDMDTPRSVFKVDSNNPGSDIAGEIAAALAAASIVFRQCDPSYSNLLLQRAITVNNERKKNVLTINPHVLLLLLHLIIM